VQIPDPETRSLRISEVDHQRIVRVDGRPVDLGALVSFLKSENFFGCHQTVRRNEEGLCSIKGINGTCDEFERVQFDQVERLSRNALSGEKQGRERVRRSLQQQRRHIDFTYSFSETDHNGPIPENKDIRQARGPSVGNVGGAMAVV